MRQARIQNWLGARARSGISLVYICIALPVMAGMCSFAVDYGYAQLVKTELRRVADATAHDYIVLYSINGKTHANTIGPQTYAQSANPVFSLSNPPTMRVTWGYWNPTTKSFSTSDNGGTVAIRVIASYTQARGNALPLLFGSVLGARSVDISATSIATYVPQQTVNVTVASTSNPYLAGMPAGTTSAAGDNTANNGATQVTGISVTPGSVLTFTNLTGTASVTYPSMPYVGPAGTSSGVYGTSTQHGVSWDGTGSPGTENGIADAIMGESSFMGLFLDDNRPDSTPAPSTVVDWTTSAMKNQSVYSSLQTKAPFYIGDGKTSGGTVKQFIVPPGATRLYIAAWDGIQFNNNSGSFSGTITRRASVQIVK